MRSPSAGPNIFQYAGVLEKIGGADVFHTSQNPVILNLFAAQTFRFSGLEKRTTTGNRSKLAFFMSRSTKIVEFGTFSICG